MQELVADHLFQPLDLLADRRLGAMNPFAGAGEATGIDHRNKAAEKVKIEHWRTHSKLE